MANHALFIPGLGDKRTFGQDIAIQLWRLFGLRPHYLALGWHKNVGLDAKLQPLLDLIAKLQSEGHVVSLVGASAGASAVINTYMKNKDIKRVIYICGKINRPGAVSSSYYSKNPDFEASLTKLQDNLKQLTPADKQKFLNIYPYVDNVVPYPDTKIDGVAELKIPGWSHAVGIMCGIILGAPAIAKFIRKQSP